MNDDNEVGWVKGSAGMIVFACLLGGMWILLFKAGTALFKATGL